MYILPVAIFMVLLQMFTFFVPLLWVGIAWALRTQSRMMQYLLNLLLLLLQDLDMRYNQNLEKSTRIKTKNS